MVRFVALLSTLLMLGGCEGSLSHLIQRSHSSPSATAQPLIYTLEDQRRVAFSRVDSQRFCAEPPATAAEQITQTIATALKQQQGTAAQPLNASEAEQIEQIYQRAHTLQLFRDAAFFLCINALTQEPGNTPSFQRYEQSVRELVRQLSAPLQEEVRLYYQAEMARHRSAGGRQEMIVCTPLTEANADNRVNCQRLQAPAERSPDVIAPPHLPATPGNRPVM